MKGEHLSCDSQLHILSPGNLGHPFYALGAEPGPAGIYRLLLP